VSLFLEVCGLHNAVREYMDDRVCYVRTGLTSSPVYIIDVLISLLWSQVTVRKLVNAKYCEKFAHVIWKDGRVMHVNVTQQLHRSYKERIAVVNDAILRRYVARQILPYNK